MDKKVIATGLIAGLVGLACTTIFQQLIPIRDQLVYKEAPNEEMVLEVLDINLPETGLYLLPGHSPPDSLFRERYEEGPIFRIHSLRRGAGGTPHVFIPVLGLLMAPIIPSWYLWRICRDERPGFGSRVFRVGLFGVFLALWADLRMWGMELYPLNYALFLAATSVATWIIVGLVIAWRIKPGPVSTYAVSGPHPSPDASMDVSL
jgi:hypothetical protein